MTTLKRTLWLPYPEQLGKDLEQISLHLGSSEIDMGLEPHNWVKLMDIEIELPSKEEVVEKVIAKLREQQRKVRVRAEEVVEELEQTLQQFLALEAPK